MMRKFCTTIITALLLIGLNIAYGQSLSLYSSENFANPGNLIDKDPGTTADREYDGIPASICIKLGQSNYIKSLTIGIEQENRADFVITVSKMPLDYGAYPDYYEITYGHIYKNQGETGEIKVDVGRYARYIQLWETNQGTLVLNELTAETESRKIAYTYDKAGNRISRQLIITSNKSASNMEGKGPQEFKPDSGPGILLYPNPTSGILTFELTNLEKYENARVSVKVYSVEGSLIVEDEYKSTSFTVDITGQANGTYLLDMVVNGKKQHFTIIKQ